MASLLTHTSKDVRKAALERLDQHLQQLQLHQEQRRGVRAKAALTFDWPLMLKSESDLGRRISTYYIFK